MEMKKENTLAIVHNSYGRCLANGNVIETFYKNSYLAAPKWLKSLKIQILTGKIGFLSMVWT